MNPAFLRAACGVLMVALVIGVDACGGGDAGATEPPNPLGVADTIVLTVQADDVIIGDTLRLTVLARDASGAVVPDVVLTWRSLDPTVASVSPEGLVTALSMGEATIEVEATIPGSSMALAIDSSMIGTTSLRRVKSKFKMVVVPMIVLTPSSATIIKQDHQLFSARITNLNNQQLSTPPVIKWSSSNAAVASIDVTGLATGLTKGTTIITATVIVGSTSKQRTATLTVDDALCGNIAGVATLTATLSYDYVIGGTTTDGRIASEMHGSLKSTMTNLGWEPGIPTVVFVGPVTGSASQVETVHDSKNHETRRLEGAGAPVNIESSGAVSVMHVIVELKDCSYKADLDVSLNLTSYTDGTKDLTLPLRSASLYIGAGKKMSTTGGNPFPIVTDQDFPGHSLLWAFSNPTKDAFVPHNWAAKLLLGDSNAIIGNAQVDYVINK